MHIDKEDADMQEENPIFSPNDASIAPSEALTETMEVDQSLPNHKKPNYGTQRYSKTVNATLPSAQSVPELFEEYK